MCHLGSDFQNVIVIRVREVDMKSVCVRDVMISCLTLSSGRGLSKSAISKNEIEEIFHDVLSPGCECE